MFAGDGSQSLSPRIQLEIQELSGKEGTGQRPEAEHHGSCNNGSACSTPACCKYAQIQFLPSEPKRDSHPKHWNICPESLNPLKPYFKEPVQRNHEPGVQHATTCMESRSDRMPPARGVNHRRRARKGCAQPALVLIEESS